MNKEFEFVEGGFGWKLIATRMALEGAYAWLQGELDKGEVDLCLDRQDQYDYFGELYLDAPMIVVWDSVVSESGLNIFAVDDRISGLKVVLERYGNLDMLVYPKDGAWKVDLVYERSAA